MNLTELIKNNPDINLTISAGQLMEVLEYFFGKQEPKEDETFLTTEEAMKIANVSRPTLHRWKQAGIVPSVKWGKSVRYPKKEFLETLTRKSTK
jgi:excisionase family DNA binding protein